jgi:SAM-dependent methyltransferase
VLADQPTEIERLQLQSRVWEPAGRALLSHIPASSGAKALDLGCGVMGWLRVLSEWVGAAGSVIGSDIDDKMLAHASAFVGVESLGNVTLLQDDIFASQIPSNSFDLVHSRFQLAPLGRADEQVAIYRRLIRPGGWIVVEDPDITSWRVNPDAPAVQRLIDLIEDGFRVAGGNLNAGRDLPTLFRKIELDPIIDAHVVALPPEHPYLWLPLQFAASLRPRLEAFIGASELDELLCTAEDELKRPHTWGTTFTLIQVRARLPP